MPINFALWFQYSGSWARNGFRFIFLNFLRSKSLSICKCSTLRKEANGLVLIQIIYWKKQPNSTLVSINFEYCIYKKWTQIIKRTDLLYDGNAQPTHWCIDKNNDHIVAQENQKRNKVREGGWLIFFRTEKEYSRLSLNCTNLFK